MHLAFLLNDGEFTTGLRRINLHPSNMDKIVKATCVLLNYLKYLWILLPGSAIFGLDLGYFQNFFTFLNQAFKT